MPKYRKKPVEIDAIQWHEGSMLLKELLDFFGGLDAIGAKSIGKKNGVVTIKTLEGDMTVSDGDWVIRGVKGELYPCKPDIFAATYERVDDNA